MSAQVRDSGACSVELLIAYSHSAQAADLRRCHIVALTDPIYGHRRRAQRPWRLRDRLDERNITELITAYRDGATAASLATSHGVSLKSVKRSCAPPEYAGPLRPATNATHP